MKTENGTKNDEFIIGMMQLVFMIKGWISSGLRHSAALNQSIFIIVLSTLFTFLLAVFSTCNAADKNDIAQPVQITYETSPVQSFAVTGDGKWLVCSLEREGFTDLWLYSADPSNVVVPTRLTNDPSYESSPAFSRDGRYIAYTGTGFDVKGDIYILDTKNENRLPVRLTGRKTEDGGPCFSRSEDILYFHQIHPDETLPKLVFLDLADESKKIRRVETGTDGSDPSISPDGKKICYVSRIADQSGEIMLFNLETGKIKKVTSGPFIDSAPTWSTDGSTILFSRVFLDTDGDKKLSRRDNATIFKITPDEKKTKTFPLTIFDESCNRPKTAKGRLFFISDKNRGIGNCFSISEDGLIPAAETPWLQIKFANQLREHINTNPFLVLLSYYKVNEFFQTEESANATYMIGRIFHELNMPHAAVTALKSGSADLKNFEPFLSLSKIELASIETEIKLNSATNPDMRLQIVASGVQHLDKIAGKASGQTKIRSEIKKATLLADSDSGANSLLQAITILDKLTREFPDNHAAVSESLVLKAEIYAKLGRTDGAYSIYQSIIQDFPDQTKWVGVAVEKSLSYVLKGMQDKSLEERIRVLREIYENNQTKHPQLAAGALNRAGDLYFSDDNWARAKEVYRLVLEKYPFLPLQSVAARLSLAEILYREEQFRMALNLYEKEIENRSIHDDIYTLARKGYIYKSISSGEYLFRLGEIHAAMSRFRELIDYDYTIIEAHRGYIKCAAALHLIKEVLPMYKERMKKDPEDPVAIYGNALLLTYLENRKAILESKALLEKAININGQIEYFHQTIGYVFEVLETVYGEENNLERALESYKKAYFLNNYEMNPENRAHLALNIGNIYFNLGQYRQALLYFTERLEEGIPFDHKDTEILFYKRLGASAFQAGDNQKTIMAFSKAVTLIQHSIDPRETIRVFEKIHRYAMDQIITPASYHEKLKKSALEKAGLQAEISRELSQLSGGLLPPPSPEWYEFRDNIENLLKKQEGLFPDLLSLLADLQKEDAASSKASQDLKLYASRVRESLEHPLRLIRLEAEMTDRLGLALQEDGNWEKAADFFEKTYALNQQLGLNQNLVKNRRSIAYNQYMQAQTLHGKERMRLLERAAKNFELTADLVDQYGVTLQDEKDKEGLVNVSLQVSLDKKSSTQAAHGFSADQEKRLVSVFLTRINLELGNLAPAEKALAGQLLKYPEGKELTENDIYGVSLLYHRAGILAAAGKKYDEAFEYFDYSADLTHKQENPVSTCQNVINMAHALSRINTEKNEINNFLQKLSKRDRQASGLLDTPAFTDSIFSAGFHNTMGVYWMDTRVYSPDEMIKTVKKAEELHRAILHFNRGLGALSGGEASKSRERNALYAALFLNKAIAAYRLGEKEHSEEYFATALKTARENMLPDLEWKALLGLGKLDEALSVLSDLTILRAGCRPFEILDGFNAKVTDLVEADQAEDAFNLAEILSEYERFHRMAFVFGNPEENEKKLYQNLYPRILRIRELRSKREKAAGEKKNYLTTQIKDEETLLLKNTGKENEKLPEQISMIENRKLRENVIALLGIAADAEETADKYVATPDEGKSRDLQEKYRNLIARYQEFREECIESRSEDVSSDAITLLGPEPVEAFDIMEQLAENEVLVRLYKGKSYGSEEKKDRRPCVFSFILSPEDIDMVKHDSFFDAVNKWPRSRSINLAYEDPEIFQGLNGCALSGTHFYRSIQNRKPFKKSILSIPFSYSDMNGYEIKNLPEINNLKSPEAKRDLTNMHTLILSGNVLAYGTVPTGQGRRPDTFISYEDKNGNHVRIDEFLKGANNLSLSILSETSFTDVYLVGHLFSIYGCPTVIINKENGQKISESFLREYSDKPVRKALENALKTVSGTSANQNGKTILLGYQGMTKEETDSFLNDYFIRYISKGKAAFHDGRALEAFSFFKHAAEISARNKKFQQLLPTLLTYCRESAYLANDFKSSALYGEKLVLLMEKENPDTEKHAEALLRLGLILSRLEKFRKAIPMIDESVEILGNLELDEKQISAMSELGFLLENATEYDRALDTFKSAAEISGDIDKELLLAKQFANMGRIHDLRLSQYAAAIQNYREALFIYRESNDSARSAQILLDIGRCYRLLGNFSEADSAYKQAFHLVEKKETDIRLRAKIIIEQANNAWFQARYEEAFRLQRKALSISETCDDKLLKTISLNTSGLIWWTLGDNRKSLHELEKALDIAKTLPNREDEVASTLNNIGLVLRDTGQYQKALDTFDKALAIDKNLKSKWAIAYDLRNKALTLLKMKKAKEAIPLFRQSAKESGEIGNRINEAKALLGLSDALFEEGVHQEAESTYKKALDLSEQMNARETEWRALYGLARIELPENPQKAEELLREAVAVIEKMRSEIKIEQLKESFADNKLSVYEALVKLLADQGKTAASFEIAERSRSRNFIDLLGNSHLALNREKDQALYEKQKLIRQRIEETETLLSQSREPEEKKIYQKRLIELNHEYQNLLLQIQAENPQLSSMVSIIPLKPKQLLEQLEPETALISFYVLDREIFCWIIRKSYNRMESASEILLIRIGADRKTFGEDILEYRRMIQNLEPVEELSNKLFSILMVKTIPHLKGIKNLGIIPHGPLHYLSFATLYNGESFLAENFSIFYLPSASVWKYTKSRRQAKKNTSVLAIGNPDLGNPVFDLPFSEYEVGSIQWNFPNITVLTKEKASEEWVAKNIGKFGIIHLASHGEFNPVNPLFSSIKLSKTGAYDGNFETSEVFGLQINADMVVLSACQTGLGKITGGDDIIGLNRAFFYAGTHTVVSSLWRVSDVSTALLVKEFYRRYKSRNKADSLKYSILHVKNRYPHPGYWGAFTLVGDYE